MRQQWISEGECTFDGTRIVFRNSNYDTLRTTRDEIIVLKPKSFFDKYLELDLVNVKRIVEVGFFEGGSSILLSDIFPDAEIICIDLRGPNPAVINHIKRLGLADRVHLHYHTSQADEDRIHQIVRERWGDEKIDIVIDDASHMYDLSTRTFDILYPYVRESGLYIIEDWGYAHWHGYSGDLLDANGKLLSSMVLELVMATASYSDAVHEVRANSGMAIVRKGRRNPPPFNSIFRLNGERRWSGV